MHLNIHNGPELAEMFVQFGYVVEFPGNSTDFEFGVYVVVLLRERRLVLIVEILPSKKIHKITKKLKH